MRLRTGRTSLALAAVLAAMLLVVPVARTQSFEATPVEASLNDERDAASSGKVPPLTEAIRTEDGRVRVLIELRDAPVASYQGNMKGYRATSPRATGKNKLDLGSRDVRQYRRMLAGRQAAAEKACQKVAPSAQMLARFDVLFNGFGVAVDEAEVPAIAGLPEVARVYPDKMVYASMDASLPLIQAPAFWAELGGRDVAGAGVKVAIVDGGIRPENPMFSGAGFSFPPGFPLADDYCGAVDASFCNGKLIAARHFRTVPLHPAEFDSPLGANGHGTHVAGSAVGNFVAGAAGPDGVPEDISGVAPGAWLMAYKALWWNGSTGSGSTLDLIDAVSAAVADGADVINNSWGGPGGEDPNTDAFGPLFDAVEAAGVLAVAAAGNAGPGATTIGCPGCQPPVLTVAASSTNRIHALGFSITSPAGGPTGMACLEGTGPALGGPVGPQDVVYAGDVGDPLGCSAFPANSMDDSIALISRGACTFATKAANAAAAGADFMVVFNSVAGAPIIMGGLGASSISSCMISNGDGGAASSFVSANPGSQGEVSHPASRQTNDAFADNIASFSSRGPNGDPDVLKPEIAAPGVRILSAWSPDHPTGGSDYIIIQGTSMASPHVAGAAALMKQKHPDWGPVQIKTALTSTSVRGLVKEDAVTPADPFDRGAGRLALDRARRAAATFDEVGMAEDLCFLGCSFTRTIRNDGSRPAVWRAFTESVDPGVVVTVTPDKIKLKPGESASFQVDIDTILAEPNVWQFGGVLWSAHGKRSRDDDSDSDSGSDSDSDSDSRGGRGRGQIADAYLPFAVFSAGSTDAMQLVKTVDKPVAGQNERLTYDIDLTNLTLVEPIDLLDVVPDGTSFVPGSEAAIVDGVPDPSFVYNPGTNSLTWSGLLDALTLEWVPGSAPFGYFPLSVFSGTLLPCSSVCDDTSITLSGFPSFDYAGASYSSVVMGSNGFAVAGSDSTNAFTPFNSNLPDAGPPNNVIAPFWTDIDMDGTSATDSGAGIWYAALLSAGPNLYLVLEWQGVEIFGVPGPTFTFQIWIQLGTSNIWAVYAGLPFIPGALTVGVEDSAGTGGSAYYFDGAGTAPAAGSDLQVDFGPGSIANFTFQADTTCDTGPVVNLVEVTSGSQSAAAFAATNVVGGSTACDDDSDSDSDSG